MVPASFDYKPPILAIIFGFILFSVFSVFFYNEIFSGMQSVRLIRISALSPEIAFWLTVLLLAASLSFAILAGLTILHTLTSDHKPLVINKDCIEIPKTLLQNSCKIKYAEIKKVEAIQVKANKTIIFYTSFGKKHIVSSNFKNKEEFRRAENLLTVFIPMSKLNK